MANQDVIVEGCFTKDSRDIINNNFHNVPQLNAASNAFSGTVKAAGVSVAPAVLSASAPAVDPHTSAAYMFTRAGVVAATLAAPTATTDDGVTIQFTSTTTDQDTVTFTGSTLNSGATGALTATFPVHAGATLTVRAYQGAWYLISNNLVVIT